ncbi:MAG: hydroxyacid dehydrogenase [Chloroflexi bacterium]|nr:MAG: hydroxyacid dehydrogenase [Chloroflexota bacterium]
MTARVACLSPYSQETVRELFKGRHQVEVVLVPDPPAQQAVLEATQEAHLVIADKRHKHRIDRRVLENMRNCLLIQQAAVGFDAIDHRAAAEYGIPVANAAGYNRDAVADWTVMAILNILRKGAYGDRLVRDGAWLREELLGHELGALTVGIVGLGNVGGTVARRLDGFGSSLVFTDPDPTRDHPGAKRVGLDELLRTADVVCLHVPLDVETRGLIGAEALAALKPGAILVNAARGPLVDEAALVEALGSGRLAGAALDVYEVEPLPAGSPLRDFDNVFLSPHIGGGTLEAEARVLEMVGANLLRMLDGEPPVNVVNAVLVAQK